ncbi:hypothetical protein HOC13_04425, partial [Candidatus Woesearchaeota archaeon]|nr:hypothetical protein [Candidatus Woesearchaeota archaeon]
MKLKLKLFAIFILVIMLASVIPAALSDNPSLSIDSYWINGQDKITLQKGQETKFTVNVDLMPQGMNLEVDPVYIETNMFKKGKSEIFHNWVDLPNWKTNFQEVFTVDTSLDKYTPGEYIISTIVTEEDNSYTEQEITLTLLPAQGQEILGCTDPDAENFEPEATENDGSCIYEQPCEDKDDDGVCDEDDICPDEPGPKENDGCPEDDNEKPEFYDNLNDKYIITETETLYLPILIEDEQENSLEVGYKKCSAWDFFELFCTVEDWNQDYQLEETSENHFMFSWTPDYTYVKHPGKTKNIDLIFTASDGDLSTKKEIKILVKDKNQLPEVDFYNLNSPFEENKPVAILAVTDDKDTEDELTIIKTTQPIWLNAEVDDGDIIFTGTPDCDSSGHHSISITVTDGIDEVTENHFFKVEETCDLPCEDTDEDGICDVDEVLGCTDPEAENFNPEATEEDNSCEYLCPDHDNDGVCDVDEKWGCTDPEAENFNPDATEGDNSCTYEQPCEDHDKDGICDQDEVFGCTNENALNFDPD